MSRLLDNKINFSREGQVAGKRSLVSELGTVESPAGKWATGGGGLALVPDAGATWFMGAGGAEVGGNWSQSW